MYSNYNSNIKYVATIIKYIDFEPIYLVESIKIIFSLKKI